MRKNLFALLMLSMVLVPGQGMAAGNDVLGAVIGAGAGAVIGHQINRRGGAGQGAVIGALGGYFLGKQMGKQMGKGAKAARQIPEQLREIRERVTSLLNAGWKKVRVVTDHGWLLLPGGLPVEKLPSFLADTRWGRCAVLKQSSQTTGLVVPGLWSARVRIIRSGTSSAVWAKRPIWPKGW